MKRELNAPLAFPGDWTFQSKSTSSTYTALQHRTWFNARAEASSALGVCPEDLTLIKSPL